MAPRIQNLRVVDPVLTNLARGYTNAEFIGEKLFPVAPMQKESGKIPVFGTENFRVHETKRAMRAGSNRISPEDNEPLSVVLGEDDLEYPIDYREGEESIFDLESHATDVTQEGLRLRHEYRCATLAQSTGSYTSGHAEALSGTDIITDAASLPIIMVGDAKETIRQKIGRMPNTLWMGAQVYNVLKEHPTLLEKIKYSQKGIVTPELMAEIFDVNEVIVGRGTYEAQSGTMADLWTNALGLMYVNPGRSGGKRNHKDASFGYTLRKTGYPQTDTYDENGGKLHIVRTTDREEVVVLGKSAGFLFTNVVGS
jgi:hypothetical protein